MSLVPDDRPLPESVAPAFDEDRWWELTERKAKVLARSRLLPQQFWDKPDEIMAAALSLREAGLPVNILTLGQMYFPNGRPEFMTQTKIVMAHRQGYDIREVPGMCNRETVTVEIRRPNSDEWQQVTFDIEDAKQAGLTGKDTYKHYPQDMLFYRAVCRAIRRYAPHLLFGMDLDDDPIPPSSDTPADPKTVADLLEAVGKLSDGQKQQLNDRLRNPDDPTKYVVPAIGSGPQFTAEHARRVQLELAVINATPTTTRKHRSNAP